MIGVEHAFGNKKAVLRWRLVRHSDALHKVSGAPANYIDYRWKPLVSDRGRGGGPYDAKATFADCLLAAIFNAHASSPTLTHRRASRTVPVSHAETCRVPEGASPRASGTGTSGTEQRTAHQ